MTGQVTVARSGSILPKVELRNVNMRYFGLEGETEALKDISFSVAPGEFIAIIGQSGCGKSTLLSLISGILKPTDGTVLVDGKPVSGPNHKIGYMLQQDYLFEWRTILENTVLGAEIQGADMRKARSRARELLTRYGLGRFLDYLPRQLSGGMRQRVALARTLCTEPDVVLLDEPFSALDAFTRADLQDHLLDLWADAKPTLVMVTHDVEEAIVLADRIVVMRPHPGRVYEEIACDLPRPRDRQSAAFDFVKRRVLAALDRSLERTVVTDDGETKAAAGGGMWW